MSRLNKLLATYRQARAADDRAGEGINSSNMMGDELADHLESMAVSPLDRQLIDQFFQTSELQRFYSVSGIYLRIHAFIDDGLAQARAQHDGECEMRDGFRRWCQCASRRDCLRCKGMGYGLSDKLWCESCGGSIEESTLADD